MADPIAQKAPDSFIPKLLARYGALQQAGVPTDQYAPLAQLDLAKARVGASPMSVPDLKLALNAIQTGQSPVQQPSPSLFQSFKNDIGDLVGNLPHLPGQLINEAENLPQGLSGFASDISQGNIGKAFQEPGIRMLPGSFLLGHGLSGYEQHPLLGALDLAPYLKEGLGLIPEEALQKVTTPLGNFMDKYNLGPMASKTARFAAQSNREMSGAFAETANQIAKISEGLSDEDKVRLTQIAQRGNPAEIAALPKDEITKISQIRDASNALVQKGKDLGVLGEFDNETYPVAQAKRLQDARTKYWNAVTEGDQTKAQTALDNFKLLNDKYAPGRFQPMLDTEFQSKVSQLAQSNNPELHGQAWDEVQKLINGRYYNLIPNVTSEDLSHLSEEVTPTWTSLKQAGLDPILIHTAGSDDLARLNMPHIDPRAVPSVQSVRAQTWNMGQGVSNFAVGLNQTAMELLQQAGTKEAVGKIAGAFGVPYSELVKDNLPIAEGMSDAGGRSLQDRVEQLIHRDHVLWDPNNPMKPFGGVPNADSIFIPKTVQTTLEKLYPTQTAVKGLWDNTMKVFRTSVLPLSPRWMAYSLLGGSVTLMAETSPWALLKYGKEAIEMVRDGKMPDEISRGATGVPLEDRTWNTAAGSTMHGWLKDSWVKDAISKGLDPAKQVIAKSYQFHEMIDKFYRSVGYLYGRDKGLAKGLSEEAAQEAGFKIGNKVLQDWDGMTPLERQVIRSVFPFYGWVKHIMSFVGSYPWDHPYRASIYANFARNEMQDRATGLPKQFDDYLFFGKADQYGNQQALNVRGLNPFKDVGNMFSLAGLMSQMNPVTTGLMTAMGFNTATGTQSLYPTVVYNPETGKLEAAAKNPFMSVLTGVVPQTAGIMSILGLDPAEIRALKANNPDAYKARIFSSFGLPALPREVNKNLEIARATLNANKALQDTLKTAIKTGDYSEISKYPQMRPIIQRLEELTKSGALDSLKIQPEGSPTFDVKNLVSSLNASSNNG